jgi:hypothetical protein
MSMSFVFTLEESNAMQQLFIALESVDSKLKPLIWQAFRCARSQQFLNAVTIELEKYNVRKTEERLHLEERKKTRVLKNAVVEQLDTLEKTYTKIISEIVSVKSVVIKVPCLIHSDETEFSEEVECAARLAVHLSREASRLEYDVVSARRRGDINTVAELQSKIAEMITKVNENAVLASPHSLVTQTTRSGKQFEWFSKFSTFKLDHPRFLGFYQPTADGNFMFRIGLGFEGGNSAYHTAEHFLDKTFQLQFGAAIRESGLEFVVADPIASQKFTIKAPVQPDVKASYLAELTRLQHENSVLYSRLRALGVPDYDC